MDRGLARCWLSPYDPLEGSPYEPLEGPQFCPLLPLPFLNTQQQRKTLFALTGSLFSIAMDGYRAMLTIKFAGYVSPSISGGEHCSKLELSTTSKGSSKGVKVLLAISTNWNFCPDTIAARQRRGLCVVWTHHELTSNPRIIDHNTDSSETSKITIR